MKIKWTLSTLLLFFASQNFANGHFLNPALEVGISQTGNLVDDPFVLLENLFFENGAPQTYLWSGPGIADPTAYTQQATQPGIYSLTVTDTLAGCTGAAQIVVLPGAVCGNADSPVPPADSCSVAPPFCDSYLSGYCSVNGFYSPDAPGNLQGELTCQVENNQWLSFVACEDTVKLEIEVTNCLGGDGLEFSVLKTADCQNFSAVTNCTIIPAGDTVLVVAGGLAPGDPYLLMADGINGDICQWRVLGTFGVSNGGEFQEDNTPGQVTGPTSVCLDGPATLAFGFTPPTCLLEDLGGCPPASQLLCEPHLDTCYTYMYDTVWHIEPPGIAQFVNNDSTGATVEVVLDPDSIIIPPGQQFVELEIFVDPFYVLPSPADTFPCWDNCLSGCATIYPDSDGDLCEVKPLKFKACKPDEIYEQFSVCLGECVDFMGQTFCGPGVHTFIEEDPCGCEDVYIIEIFEEFVPFPVIGSAVVACSPDGLTYTVSFDILTFGYWDVFVDGAPFFGNTFTSGPIPSGDNYQFEIEAHDFLCGEIFVDIVPGTHECSCVPQTFNEGLIALCPGDCYDLAGNIFCDPGDYMEEIFNPVTGCDDIYIFEIENIDEPPLTSGAVTELCNFVNTDYTVTFSIEGGVAPYFVDGNPVSGNLYQSAPIPTGDAYFFQITDSGVCGDDMLVIAGDFTCPCITDPGTVEQSLLATCADEMVSANWNNDATLDGDDLLVFVLHTGAGAALGDVIGTNVTGTFGFVPGLMEFGDTYYISAVAGNDAGGTVDFNDACLGVSPGQPVVFYENPQVDVLPTGELTCDVTAVPLDAFPGGGSGQFSFEWSGPGLSASGQTALATQPGTFTVTLIDELSGCTATASLEVVADDEMPVFQVIPSGNQLTCDVQSILLETSTAQPDLVFEWTLSSGSTAGGTSILVDEPGGYSVVATAPNGCTSEVAGNISQDISPPANVQATGATLTCDAPAATLFASSSTAGAGFVWVFPSGNTQAGASISTSEGGGYALIATGANGCTAETTATVTEDLLPPANVQASAAELTCDLTVATLGVTSSSLGVVFDWVFPTGNESTGPSIVTDIVGQYTVTATGQNGCTAQVLTNIYEDTAPPENVTATDGELTCGNQTAALTASSSTAGVTFAWVFPSGNMLAGASISTGEAGNYTLVATAPNGCTAEAQSSVIDLTEPPEDLTASDGELTCDEPTATLTASSSTAGVTYVWVFPSGNTQAGASISTSEAGGYTLVATAPNGCTAELSAEVQDSTDPPAVTVTGGGLNCAQQETILQAGSDMPGSVFTWLLPDGSMAVGASLNATATGSYTVTVLAPNGCETTAPTQVLAIPDPEIIAEIMLQPPTCFGDSDGALFVETLTGGTAPYSIFANGEPLSGDSLANLPAGFYQLAITDADGCASETLVEIQPPPEVAVSIGEDQFITLGDDVFLEMDTDIAPASIEWFGPNGQTWQGLSSLTVRPSGNVTYRLRISDANGCTAEDEMQVFVKGEGRVYVPSAFSPNGDEVNDILTVFGGEDVLQVRSFSIYDRWGDLVYKGENFAPNNPSTASGWDGHYGDEQANSGVFVYKVEVEFLTGETKVFVGDVVLVR